MMSWTKIEFVQVKMHVTFKLRTLSLILLCNRYDLLHVSCINYHLFIACRSYLCG